MYEIICFDKYGNSIDELVQWDINRQLYINWVHDCTPIFQFGNTKSDRLLVVKGRLIKEELKTIAEVNIPNILLQQPYPILGFVYLENEVDGNEGYFTGKTVFNFTIPVRKKKKPEDYKYQENTEYISWVNLEAEAKTFIAELEVETNRIITELEDTLRSAKDNAESSALSANESKTSEVNAKASELNANTSEANAKISEIASKASEDNAKLSEDNAQESEIAAKTSEDNALLSEINAKASEIAAKTSETNAKVSEINAKVSETNADESEANAKESEEKAGISENNARISEANAKISETNAKSSEDKAVQLVTNANDWAVLSQSYAVGDTNTRENENLDNSKYYCERTSIIYDSLGGVFTPMGSIYFEELSVAEKQTGYVYHIIDSFTTDDTFKCGAGILYSSGTNVYYTADGYWSCFSGRYIADSEFTTLINTISLLEERIKAMEDVTVLEIVE